MDDTLRYIGCLWGHARSAIAENIVGVDRDTIFHCSVDTCSRTLFISAKFYLMPNYLTSSDLKNCRSNHKSEPCV